MDADELRVKEKAHAVEVKKLWISGFTPVILIALTFVVNNAIQERGAALKRDEQIIADKKRLYAELGIKLNIFYIYATDRGDFANYTPVQIVKLKREADRLFNMYLPYWSDKTESHYGEFMQSTFQTYTGMGRPPQIVGTTENKVAAQKEANLTWDPAWDEYFTGSQDSTINVKYYALVKSLLADTANPGIGKGERHKERISGAMEWLEEIKSKWLK